MYGQALKVIFKKLLKEEPEQGMGIRWFRLDDFYEKDGDVYIFYPSLYARGYLFSSEYRARMDSVLGPFLNDRLKMEFVALLCLVTSALVGASTAFLVTASTDCFEGPAGTDSDGVPRMTVGSWELCGASP